MNAVRDVTRARLGLLMMRHHRFASMMRRFGVMQGEGFWQKSKSVDEAVAAVDPTHPDLNAGGIRSLKSVSGRRTYLEERASELVFYWNSWRHITSGSAKQMVAK